MKLNKRDFRISVIAACIFLTVAIICISSSVSHFFQNYHLKTMGVLTEGKVVSLNLAWRAPLSQNFPGDLKTQPMYVYKVQYIDEGREFESSFQSFVKYSQGDAVPVLFSPLHPNVSIANVHREKLLDSEDFVKQGFVLFCGLWFLGLFIWLVNVVLTARRSEFSNISSTHKR